MMYTYSEKQKDNILELTEEAYSRDRYGEVIWERLIENLGLDGYKPEETIWILNSKYARWAADAFGKMSNDERDPNESFDGTELRQYKKKHGIDIIIRDLPEIIEQLKNLDKPKLKNGF